MSSRSTTTPSPFLQPTSSHASQQMSTPSREIQNLLDLPAIRHETNLAYLPLPNRVEMVLTQNLAPLSHTRTAFVVVLTPDGRLIMAQNRRRGVEFSGGHIDPGETAHAAALREAHEEVGATLRSITPLGVLRMQSDGYVPSDHPYPHPLGFQQFFVGMLDYLDPYTENDECLQPKILTVTEALNPHGPLSAAQTAWYQAAVAAYGSDAAACTHTHTQAVVPEA